MILRLALSLALALVSSGCVTWVTPPATSISSTPPGATVILDGQPSGYLTPCLVKLDEGRDHRVRLDLAGHRSQEIVLRENGDVFLIPWSSGYDAPYGWRVPFFLEAYDVFVPVRIDEGLSPDRLHLTLEEVEPSS